MWPYRGMHYAEHYITQLYQITKEIIWPEVFSSLLYRIPTHELQAL